MTMLGRVMFGAALWFGLGAAWGQAVAAPGAGATAQAGGTITVNVQVQGPGGVAVRGLQAGSLTVLDNGVERPLLSVVEKNGQSGAARVIVVLDSVNVPHGAIDSERQRLEHYWMVRPEVTLPTTFAVLTDTGVQMQPGFSEDGRQLSGALDRTEIGLRALTRAGGFYGATDRLQVSLSGLEQLVAAAGKMPGRTLMVWLSPGWPLLSGPGVQLSEAQAEQVFRSAVRLNTLMRENGVTLYDVDAWGPDEGLLRADYYREFLKGLRDARQAELGDLGLQVLATQSGGVAEAPSNDVKAGLDQAYADGAGWYAVSFAAPAGERRDEYNALEVKASGGKARTWEGYYANPDVGEKVGVPAPVPAKP